MIEAILAGLFGLLIGSFLNVCIYRLPRDLSVAQPARSFCPSCERSIAWYWNIPLVSFILLGGKCRECGAAIPQRYWIVEAATGALFFAAVAYGGVTALAIKLCIFGALNIALIATDLETRLLPDELTLGGAAAGLAISAFSVLPAGLAGLLLPSIENVRVLSFAEALLGAIAGSGILWGIAFLYQKARGREGLGLGDVKMAAMIGAFTGLSGLLLTLMIGSAVGAITGLLYLRVARKDASTYELPFGSFLGAAAVFVAFFGERVTGWWLNVGG